MSAGTDGKYTSVWSRPARPERSTLTREQIVTEAIALLDAEGIDALSMRKLAARLKSGATSLYWHVANRDELLQLVLDEIYGEVEIPDVDDVSDWRSATSRFAYSVRGAVHRHPWMVSVLDQIAVASNGPNLLATTERMITLLEQAGFDLREAERVMSTVSAYTLGIAITEASYLSWMNRHGTTGEARLRDELEAARDLAKDHPKVHELFASYADTDVYRTMDADFEYGLDRLLDGIAQRLPSSG